MTPLGCRDSPRAGYEHLGNGTYSTPRPRALSALRHPAVVTFGGLKHSEHSVQVGDQHFVIHKPYWGHAEVHLGGEPLTRDAYGNLVLLDGRGGRRKISATFDVRQLSPALDVDGTRHLTLPPLPWHLRLALLLLVAVSVAVAAVGALPGLIGALLGLLAASGIAAATRRRSPAPTLSAAISAAVTAGAGWLVYSSWS